jgi:hypothetical protein
MVMFMPKMRHRNMKEKACFARQTRARQKILPRSMGAGQSMFEVSLNRHICSHSRHPARVPAMIKSHVPTSRSSAIRRGAAIPI